MTLNQNELDIEPRLDAYVGTQFTPNRYPPMFATELRRTLANNLNFSESNMFIASGAAGALQITLGRICTDSEKVSFLWPTFSAFSTIIRSVRATPDPVEVHRTSDAYDDLIEHICKVRPAAVIICNPHNPTGMCIQGARLRCVIDRVPDDVYVILDEVYRGFCAHDAIDIHQLVRERPNVVVLRSLSKEYGLAALRIGFGISNESLVAEAESVAIPYSISKHSQDLASYILENDEQKEMISSARREIMENRTVLIDILRERGVQVADSCGNFIWLARSAYSDALSGDLARRGLHVRTEGDLGYRLTVPGLARLPQVISAIESAASSFDVIQRKRIDISTSFSEGVS